MKFKITLLALIAGLSLNIFSSDPRDKDIIVDGLGCNLYHLDDATRIVSSVAVLAQKPVLNQRGVIKIIEIANKCPEIRHFDFEIRIFNVATEYYLQLAENNKKP